MINNDSLDLLKINTNLENNKFSESDPTNSSI